jgi:ATP-dependent Clp protease ATP-binding subunit ClpB
MHSSPAELDKAQRELIHMKTERASLLKETDEQSKKRLNEIEAEISSLENKEKTLRTQ